MKRSLQTIEQIEVIQQVVPLEVSKLNDYVNKNKEIKYSFLQKKIDCKKRKKDSSPLPNMLYRSVYCIRSRLSIIQLFSHEATFFENIFVYRKYKKHVTNKI